MASRKLSLRNTGLRGDPACQIWREFSNFPDRASLPRRLPFRECIVQPATDRDPVRALPGFPATGEATGRVKLLFVVRTDHALTCREGKRLYDARKFNFLHDVFDGFIHSK